MKRLLVCLLSVIVAVLFVGPELQAQDAPQGELRIWKDSTGQFSIEAVFVRLRGDLVVLQQKDKTEISVPLAKLSQPDLKYVQVQAKTRFVSVTLSQTRTADLNSWRSRPVNTGYRSGILE